jgi:hypothetical protein
MSAHSQQAAKNFVLKQYDTLTSDIIYLTTTDDLLYSNESIVTMDNWNELDSLSQIELVKKYTIIGNKVNDSIILKQFYTAFLETLKTLGLKVILTKYDKIPDSLSPREHILNIRQLELEEFVTNDSIYADYNGKPYIYRKHLNGVRFNVWLFYNEKDSIQKLTLFCNEEITDNFQGSMEFKHGKPVINYTLTKINPNDAYKVAYASGKTSAIYFFNLLLNQYVFKETNGEDTHFYGLDFESGNLIMDDEPFDNFDVIEN